MNNQINTKAIWDNTDPETGVYDESRGDFIDMLKTNKQDEDTGSTLAEDKQEDRYVPSGFSGSSTQEGDLNKDVDTKEIDKNEAVIIDLLKDSGVFPGDFEYSGGDGDVSFTETINNRINDLAKEYADNKFNSLPAHFKEAVNIYMQGGDGMQYIKEIYSEDKGDIISDLDISKEEDQKALVSYKLKSDGFDNELIAKNIEILKKEDKLKSFAKSIYDAHKLSLEERSRSIQEEQARQRELYNQEVRAKRNEIYNTLSHTSDINGIVITPDDKRYLPDYLRLPRVQRDGSMSTQLVEDLVKINSDKNKSILLAKIIRTGLDVNKLRHMFNNGVVKGKVPGVRSARDYVNMLRSK